MAKKQGVSLFKWLSGNTAADQQRYKVYADADRFTRQLIINDRKLGKLAEEIGKFREAHPEVCTGVYIKHKKLELKRMPIMFPLYGVFFALVRSILVIVCYVVSIATLTPFLSPKSNLTPNR
jgi:hypothetical protein